MNRQSRTKSVVDWNLIHERLAKASTGVQEYSPERIQALLEERAWMLAAVPAASESPREVLKLVSFSSGGELYALEACYTREVIRCADLMPVPGLPDFFLGLTIVRGELLPAIHLAKFLGLPHTQIREPSRLLVAGGETKHLGLGVDDIDELLEVSPDDLREAPEQGPSHARRYVRGMTRDALIVLDGAALLNDTFGEERNGVE